MNVISDGSKISYEMDLEREREREREIERERDGRGLNKIRFKEEIYVI